MARDFTYRAYADLLDAADAAGFEFLTVREVLSGKPLPPRFLVLRHDVTRKPEKALDLARIEAAREARGTYYVRTAERAFDRDAVRALEAAGHEVGYCHAALDRADGDRERARDLFEAELARLRRDARVETVCAHENPLTPHDNGALLERRDLERLGLRGSPGRAIDAVDATCFSDDGRAWRDDPPARPDATGLLDAAGTGDLVDLVRRHRISRAVLWVRPARWADSYPEIVATRTRDAAVNAARRGLQLIS